MVGELGVGTAVGQGEPRARVFVGGQYSNSEKSGFLLFRRFLSSVWKMSESCLVWRCFWRPAAVLYFFSQWLHFKSSEVSLHASLFTFSISVDLSELSRSNVFFRTLLKNHTGALEPDISLDPCN